jgi:hypothetical protein
MAWLILLAANSSLQRLGLLISTLILETVLKWELANQCLMAMKLIIY